MITKEQPVFFFLRNFKMLMKLNVGFVLFCFVLFLVSRGRQSTGSEKKTHQRKSQGHEIKLCFLCSFIVV